MGRMSDAPRYVGDFETTVYKNQTFTEVWASALVEVGSEDVTVFNSLDATYQYLKDLKSDVIIYYHNLKFDGTFWLSWLFNHGYKNGFIDGLNKWKKDKDLGRKEVKYIISDRGQWYKILFKIGKFKIELRDSLKLLPFSVKQIGEDFKTKHKKTDIIYDGYRAAGGVISPEEEEYIKNDVLVVSEALSYMFNDGHTRITIGSCCMAEFKALFLEEDAYDKKDYEILFPDLNKDILTERWEISIHDTVKN